MKREETVCLDQKLFVSFSPIRWDQREPIHTKQDPANDDITTSSVTTNQTSLSSNSIS